MQEFKKILLVLLGCVAYTQSQTTIVNCANWNVNGVHTCVVALATISDNENQNFLVTGAVLGMRSLEIRTPSTVPFIISQLFVSLPNIFRVIIQPTHLNRLQTGAFRNASNMELLIINNNPLRRIQDNAFRGANSLITIDLRMNQIEVIQEHAFNGLTNLENLMLENNVIRRLPSNVFRPMANLENLFLSDNIIEEIDGGSFISNHKLRNLDLLRNRINEIGRTVLDELPNLEFVILSGNRCANNFWLINDGNSKEIVRWGLARCFANFDATKRVGAEIRGNFTISDDYGNVIYNL